MRKLRLFLFFALLAIYSLGICIGGVRQVKSSNQTEMYDYLSGAVTDSSTAFAKNIKSVLRDNAVSLVVLALSGLFRAGLAFIPAVVFAKGYASGFSITAALRLFGIRGLVLCGANILSVMFLIPCTAYYGSLAGYNLLSRDSSTPKFLKKYFIALAFITAVFCIDALFRGTMSALFMKWAQTMTKSA